VNDQTDDALAGIDRRGHRVDQKRHVVVDDLDDRVRRRPAVYVRLRVIYPDLGLAGLPAPGKAPQRQRRAGKIAQAALGDVVGRHVVVEFGDYRRGGGVLGKVQAFRGEGGRLTDQLGLFRFAGRGLVRSLAGVEPYGSPRQWEVDCVAHRALNTGYSPVSGQVVWDIGDCRKLWQSRQ
jgi:hypothetical protein